MKEAVWPTHRLAIYKHVRRYRAGVEGKREFESKLIRNQKKSSCVALSNMGKRELSLGGWIAVWDCSEVCFACPRGSPSLSPRPASILSLRRSAFLFQWSQLASAIFSRRLPPESTASLSITIPPAALVHILHTYHMQKASLGQDFTCQRGALSCSLPFPPPCLPAFTKSESTHIIAGAILSR